MKTQVDILFFKLILGEKRSLDAHFCLQTSRILFQSLEEKQTCFCRGFKELTSLSRAHQQ